MAVKKSDLYSSLWASCDELRGGMDASQYKDYVLFMLFIKYVSDKYGESDDFEPPIRIPKGANFKDMVALKGNPEIGDRINTQVIQPLVDANTMLARTDFPDFDDPNKLGEGSDKVDRLERLIAIFQNPNLDFSGNRAENDDILGDAYEYLMRHFATESGKSKGQFYTPSEVSRVIAKVIGISPKNTVGSTTAYDPTCGSGSLLLKVAAEAGRRITLEGQEKDVTTAGLARMNMILHDFPTAKIVSGNTLTQPKFLENDRLRTYDYVVANPPFSDKAWSTGFEFDGEGIKDKFTRFTFGTPPAKQGDYAYLLHIIRSMKSTGKAACILPHGVLFRGNAEAVIREALVRSGILKGIIGLPANLFFGTGIPACILVLDKENAAARKGVFMIDASKGFIKDGAKNRLREQDVHKIVDAFTKGTEIPRYARAVPFDEIADAKNAFNLNLPRYIDASDPEDLQDIDAHLRGGLPERDINALAPYWAVMPALRDTLFAPGDRPGYHQMRLPQAEVKTAILNHPEFRAFTDTATQIFDAWRARTAPKLNAFGQGGHPKDLIDEISEDMLLAFRAAPLVGAYDTYQHLMDYWAEAMQDDCYLISADGWVKGCQPREIKQIKVKDKLTWPEAHDFLIGRRRFKSDLIPAGLLIAAFFFKEQAAIDAMDAQISELEQQLADTLEEGATEDGLLAEVIEGEGDKAKITAKAIKARLKEIGRDAAFAEERSALKDYLALIDELADVRARRKAAETKLHQLVHDKYGILTEDQVKNLTINAKWLARLSADVRGEVSRVSQTLTGRVRQLGERYEKTLDTLEAELQERTAKVAQHLKAAMHFIRTGETLGRGFSEQWKPVKLADHVTFLKNGSHSRAQLSEDDSVRYLHYGDIHTAPGVRLNPLSVSMPRLSTHLARNLSRLADGDLILVDASEDLDGVGKAVELNSSDGIDIVAGQHTIAARFDKGVLADGFKAYLPFIPEFRQHLRRLAAGTKVYATNRKHIASVEMGLPNIAEQTAIAGVLMDIDAVIEALGAREEKVRSLKQAMVQALLTGYVRLPIPENANG